MPWSPAPWCASHRTVKLCGVRHTAESIDQKFLKILLCASYHWAWLPVGVHPTAKSAVCILSHRRVKLRSVHPTEESSSAVCIAPRSQTAQSRVNIEIFESLVAFKGTIRRNPFRGEHIYHERKDLKTNFLFAKPKILTPRCHAHRGVEFF